MSRDPVEAAFEVFVHKHLETALLPVARRYAALRALPETSVREIAVEALTRVWQKSWCRLYSATDDERLRSVYTYMQFVAREERTKLTRLPEPMCLDTLVDKAVNARMDDQVLARIALTVLSRALASLPHQDRAIVELSAIAGMSSSEIAVQLGIRQSNVTTRLSRARAKLKDAVGQDLLRELGIGGFSDPQQGGAA